MKTTFKWIGCIRPLVAAACLLSAATLVQAIIPTRIPILSRFQVNRPLGVNVNAASRLTTQGLKAVKPPTSSAVAGTWRNPELAKIRAIKLPEDHPLWTSSLKNFAFEQSAHGAAEKVKPITSGTKGNWDNLALNTLKTDEFRGLSFDVKPPPKVTAASLSRDMAKQPKSALAEQHAAVGAVGRRFDDDSNRKALVALAQSVKSSVEFDNPKFASTLGHYADRQEAEDAIREVTAALVEHDLRAHPLSEIWLKMRFRLATDVDKKFDPSLRGELATVNKTPEEIQRDLATARSNVEARLASALGRLRSAGKGASGDGIWTAYIKESQDGLAVRSVNITGDGSAYVKLNTPEFDHISGKVPLREISRALVRDSSTPEVAMLLSRE